MKNFKMNAHNAIMTNVNGMSNSELQRARIMFDMMKTQFADDEYGCTNAMFTNIISMIEHRENEIETCEHDFDEKPNYSYIKCKKCGIEIYE